MCYVKFPSRFVLFMSRLRNNFLTKCHKNILYVLWKIWFLHLCFWSIWNLFLNMVWAQDLTLFYLFFWIIKYANQHSLATSSFSSNIFNTICAISPVPMCMQSLSGILKAWGFNYSRKTFFLCLCGVAFFPFRFPVLEKASSRTWFSVPSLLALSSRSMALPSWVIPLAFEFLALEIYLSNLLLLPI